MPSRHQKTLVAVFEEPTRRNIRYQDVEAMLKWLGGELYERAGSRVAIVLRGRKHIYHRPHPENELGKLTVQDVRDFLTTVGIEP